MDGEQNYLIDLAKKQDLLALKEFVAQNKEFNFNFTTEKGDTLLHFCVQKITSNTLPVVQILLEKGIDPDSVNEKFITPFEIAKAANNIPAMTLMKSYRNKKIQENQS